MSMKMRSIDSLMFQLSEKYGFAMFRVTYNRLFLALNTKK